ncbi:MAG: hypothetical protein PHO92_04630 [Candidatus Peribacteraceae bacterium]|nr:hypothetical protein [Candidatus Peribacteraceae bacterium]
MPLRPSPSEDRDAPLLSGIRRDTALAIENLLGAGWYAGKAGTKATLRGVQTMSHVIRQLFR